MVAPIKLSSASKDFILEKVDARAESSAYHTWRMFRLL